MTETCDDCGRDYPGPVYYTFDPDACISTRDAVQEGERRPLTDDPDEEIVHGDDCTGNLCPSCAGPYLEPDDPDDPRRPKDPDDMEEDPDAPDDGKMLIAGILYDRATGQEADPQ